MKKIIQTTLAIGTVCLLAGCETDGLSVRERGAVNYPDYILNLPVTAANATPEKIKKPVHLAVAQVGETAPPLAMLDQLAADKSQIADVVALPMSGEQSDFVPNRRVDSSQVYSNQVKAVCGLARAAGADQIFLFGGNLDSWQEDNYLSVLNLTVVGAFVVPASEINIEGKAAGVLIDATTGVPEIFVNAAAKNSQHMPAMLVDGRAMELRVQLRDELANKLGNALLQKLADKN
jgi:hypothetical protein